jgi:hypothetical protein
MYRLHVFYLNEGIIMEIVFDKDVKMILEMMQSSIAGEKLVGIADALPQAARLLWNDCPQEPVRAATLFLPKICPSRSTASE